MHQTILDGKVAVVTGGYGVLGSSIAEGLAQAGATVVLLGRRQEAATACAREIEAAVAGATVGTAIADVTDEQQLRAACAAVVSEWGHVDILVNAAGGNVAAARTDSVPPFAMSLPAFDEVVRMNLHGTVYPTLIFGEAMANGNGGSIVNISSMAAVLAISGVAGYSAAKAAVDNFTRWLAVDVAKRHGDGIRVNAVAPGFFVTKQNRNVLIREDGSFTDRSKTILAQTPAGRFGKPEELNGLVTFLCSDAASFITGAIIPVDGGFSANSGV